MSDFESGDSQPAAFDAALAAVTADAAEQRPWLDSLLVVQGGRLVHEAYFNDARPDRLHQMYSVTKQWLSCLVGIALDRGLLPGLDVTIAEVLGERLPADVEDQRRAITLRHCLAMQSGLAFDNSMAAAMAFAAAPDPVAYAFGAACELTQAPGTSWNYSPIDAQLVAETLRQCTGRPLIDFAREVLAAPLGIDHFAWPRALVPGCPEWPAETGASGLQLTSRGLARFGLCLMRDGQVEGRQVIPGDWLKLAQTPTSGVDAAFLAQFYASIAAPAVRSQTGYGLHFGIMELAGRQVRSLAGMGGQYAIALPELDLLVVQTARTLLTDDVADVPQDGLVGGIDLILDTLLPALSG